MALPRNMRSLARVVADLEDAALNARERPALDDRLAVIHAALGRRQRVRRGSQIGFLLCSIAAAAAALLWRDRWPQWSTADAEASNAARGGMQAAPEVSLPMYSSDGTRILLSAGASARVIEVSTHGAQVELQHGTACICIIPRPDNDWSVRGGPFEIHAAGARFDVSWDPVSGWFEVTTYEGSVHIRGACLAKEVVLAEGRSEMLSCRSTWKSAVPLEARGRSPGGPDEPRQPCN